MNIQDKPRVYRGVFPVLTGGGRFVLCDVSAAGPNGSPELPLPWADVAEKSLLSTCEEARCDLLVGGSEIVSFREISLAVLARPLAMAPKDSAPVTGDVLMCERFQQMTTNSLRAIEDGRISSTERVARRPG